MSCLEACSTSTLCVSSRSFFPKFNWKSYNVRAKKCQGAACTSDLQFAMNYCLSKSMNVTYSSSLDQQLICIKAFFVQVRSRILYQGKIMLTSELYQLEAWHLFDVSWQHLNIFELMVVIAPTCFSVYYVLISVYSTCCCVSVLKLVWKTGFNGQVLNVLWIQS